jgi:CRISPR type III-B/RAMP module RAMP protein Cmr1
MKTQTFHLEIITPCFCGGAEPERQAEIRAPSIRGQLRWWFRVLGGFKSLAPLTVRKQEEMIFGSTAGDEGRAGQLLVRVLPHTIQSQVRDGQELGHRLFSDSAYLTFPVQSRERQGRKITYAGRGVLLSGAFALSLQWRGRQDLWPDLLALISVFGNLGSMGFRGRRAMGALAFQAAPEGCPSLGDSLGHFSNANAIQCHYMDAENDKDAIAKLGGWLLKWRSHGRSQDHKANRNDLSKPPLNAGFTFAKRDHDIGYGKPETQNLPAFRPALGLPIVQRTQNGKNNWEFGRGTKQDPKGRFASPVLLRPHRDASGKWHALVIFVDARRWPTDPATGRPKQVFLNTETREVSLDLYEEMKSDKALKPFLP